jgi:glycosyltransferase involved in cell wall biosynthesis
MSVNRRPENASGGPITVGLPFWNNERTLGAAIRSVLAQTIPDWLLLVVNDGSRDASEAIVRSFGDPRIRLIDDGEHRGLVYRLNQIAALAGSPFLARMDADDLMHPQRLERQMACLSGAGGPDLVASAAYIIDQEGRLVATASGEPLEATPRQALIHGLFLHPTVAGRTEWFRENPYDERYVRSEDRELWIRTCGHSKFAKIAEPLYFYRESRPPDLAKCAASHRTDRKILRRYGPAIVGVAETWRLICRSWLKDWGLKTMREIRAERLIGPWRSTRHIYRALSPGERRAAEAILEGMAERRAA